MLESLEGRRIRNLLHAVMRVGRCVGKDTRPHDVGDKDWERC